MSSYYNEKNKIRENVRAMQALMFSLSVAFPSLYYSQAKSLSSLGVFSVLALLCTPRALRKGLRAGFVRQSAGLPALSLTAFGATPVSVALLRLP